MILRWYYFLSVWVFILSALYPIHKISTFPLNILCILGLVAFNLEEPPLKNISILIIHLLPFLWIPYSFKQKSIYLFVAVIIVYYIFIRLLNESIYNVYNSVIHEHSLSNTDFINTRLGTQVKRALI